MIYNRIKKDIVEIIEGTAMIDHVHLLVSILSKMSIASFMGGFEGEKRDDDLRLVREPEIQILESTLLAAGILRKHSWVE